MSDQTEAELQRTRDVVAATAQEQAAAADALVAPEADPEAGWDEYTVDELKDELKARGLPVSGTKDELVARLEEDDA